ncbi:MAG TPA: orotidine-5'-phosphate decarboxylase [Chitinophagaceae bacterium]|nr:orotidine-5'-phosphate decarboxylase [Chitinophagaceae bacterium]
MTRQQLVEQILAKQSYLCVGLDTDPAKIPVHLLKEPDPVFAFNKAIIDATADLCVSYKINTAFYEAQGLAGWQSMQKTVEYLPENIFRIADAKRGDIGNTSAQYAQAFFKAMPFDAITVAPYMGEDSIRPFLDYAGKWTIVLGLTSNEGAKDFEWQPLAPLSADATNGATAAQVYLYEQVLQTVAAWGNTGNLMFVVGATQATAFTHIRELLPAHFLLVPGVGAQGGSLKEISEKAMNKEVGLLVNASRAILYASGKEDFAAAARSVAKGYQQEMTSYLSEAGIQPLAPVL